MPPFRRRWPEVVLPDDPAVERVRRLFERYRRLAATGQPRPPVRPLAPRGRGRRGSAA